jgi:hypothetical protein
MGIKRKYKTDETFDRYKTRSVAQGFTQVERIDYDETFSLMVKIISLHVLFALATIHDYHVHQLDVQTTFLHGHLDEEIYMEQPLSYMSSQNEHKVCELLKSNYGLKQTCPQLWYERFYAHLLKPWG